MTAQDEKFERLRDYLSKLPFLFCIVYRGRMTKGQVELKWIKAVSRDPGIHEEYDKLAGIYQEVGVHCYQRRRNLILKENLPSSNSPGKRWCGIVVPAKPNPPPANSLGQRWWHLVVGAGATRDAGYVIVARVAAKDPKELHHYVAGIQGIMRGCRVTFERRLLRAFKRRLLGHAG